MLGSTTHGEESEARSALSQTTVQKLGSWRKSDREAGAKELEMLGPEDVDALLATVHEEARKSRRSKRVSMGVMFGVLFAVVAAGAISMALSGDNSDFMSQWASYIPIFISTSAAGAYASGLQKKATARLAQFDDPRIVPPLAELLDTEDKDLRATVVSALCRILPSIESRHAQLLDTEQLGKLYKAMVRRDRPDLSLAIIGALPRIGDAAAASMVQKIVDGHAPASKLPAVVSAAAEALPLVRQRAVAVKEANTLLRPAMPLDDAATLLRPVAPSASAAHQHLVVPADGPPANA